MQATLIAAGSRGDVQPYVALGAGLKQAGHTVQILASPDFRQLIGSHELTFCDMGGSIQSVAQSMEGLLEGGNLFRILASMGPAAERMVGDAAANGLQACQGSDVIIAALGVGPQPIPRAKLTSDRLAHAVRTAVSDVRMRERAAHLGAAIRAEDGIGSAVRILEGFVKRGQA